MIEEIKKNMEIVSRMKLREFYKENRRMNEEEKPNKESEIELPPCIPFIGHLIDEFHSIYDENARSTGNSARTANTTNNAGPSTSSPADAPVNFDKLRKLYEFFGYMHEIKFKKYDFPKNKALFDYLMDIRGFYYQNTSIRTSTIINSPSLLSSSSLVHLSPSSLSPVNSLNSSTPSLLSTSLSNQFSLSSSSSLPSPFHRSFFSFLFFFPPFFLSSFPPFFLSSFLPFLLSSFFLSSYPPFLPSSFPPFFLLPFLLSVCSSPPSLFPFPNCSSVFFLCLLFSVPYHFSVFLFLSPSSSFPLPLPLLLPFPLQFFCIPLHSQPLNFLLVKIQKKKVFF